MSNEILDRYKTARTFIEGAFTRDLVINDAVFAHWINGYDLFWYQRDTNEGKEYRLVDPKNATNKIAFDHIALANCLAEVSGIGMDAADLNIIITSFDLFPLRIAFTAFQKRWVFDASSRCCREISDDFPINGLFSPDGLKVAFLRENNIWVRNISTSYERQLTYDGADDYPYATAPNCYGQRSTTKLQAIWSPDSRRLFTYQLDLRNVSSRLVIFPVATDSTNKSEVYEYKASYPGDNQVESYRFCAIFVDTGEMQNVDRMPTPSSRFGLGYFSEERLGWWGEENHLVYYVDIERGAKAISVVEFDTDTGKTRVLIKEVSDTFVRLSHSLFERPIFLPLAESNELIWFSERDGWGHLYLFDLNTGNLKRRITEGDWLVRELLHYHPGSREVLIQTSGRDSSISPYYQDICCINIDSGKLVPLVTGPYEYSIYRPESIQVEIRASLGVDISGVSGIAPSGNYVVTTRSRVDSMPVSLLLDREGNEILNLEIADNVGLPADWVWPEPISVRSADSGFELHGVIYRPPGFSAEQRYPVLDFCNAFPYYSTLPQGSFINEPCGCYYLNAAAYAALGFIVVSLNLPGSPLRDKVFQDVSYGSIPSCNAFKDRIDAFKQLAKRFPYMDIDNVGIVGSDYITGAVYGLLEHPEFYKVGVNVGFDDSRFGMASVVEMYEGVKVPEQPYTDDLVASLEGKLLLIHGLRDLSAPPEATFRLVDAFQKANKDIDMLIEPNGIHIVTSYQLCRTWDYLVKNLRQELPPQSFNLKTSYDRKYGDY